MSFWKKDKEKDEAESSHRAFLWNNDGKPHSVRMTDKQASTLPRTGELQVRVYAASLNKTDMLLEGGAEDVPSISGTGRILGTDFAGVVTRVGPGVKRFKTDDQVFGLTDMRRIGGGALQEFCIASEEFVGIKPTVTSFMEAASLGAPFFAAGMAVYRELGIPYPSRLQKGTHVAETVLVWGASGNVGSYAVQMCLLAGATVIAVCPLRNHKYVKSLGVANVFDSADLTTVPKIRELTGNKLRLAIDTVSSDTASQCVECIGATEGRLVCTNGKPSKTQLHIVKRHINVYGMFDTEDERKWAAEFMDEFVPLLEFGRIKPYNVEPVEFEVRAIEGAFHKMQAPTEGKPGGATFVVSVLPDAHDEHARIASERNVSASDEPFEVLLAKAKAMESGKARTPPRSTTPPDAHNDVSSHTAYAVPAGGAADADMDRHRNDLPIPRLDSHRRKHRSDRNAPKEEKRKHRGKAKEKEKKAKGDEHVDEHVPQPLHVTPPERRSVVLDEATRPARHVTSGSESDTEGESGEMSPHKASLPRDADSSADEYYSDPEEQYRGTAVERSTTTVVATGAATAVTAEAITEVRRTQTEIDQVNKRVAAAAAERQKLADRARRHKERAEKYERMLNEKDKEIGVLAEQLAQEAKTTVETTTRTVEQSHARAAELEQEMASLRKRKDELAQMYAAEKEQRLVEVATISSIVDQHEGQLAAAKYEIKRTNDLLSQMEAEKAMLLTEAAEQQARADKEVAVNAKKEATITALEAHLTEEQREKAQLAERAAREAREAQLAAEFALANAEDAAKLEAELKRLRREKEDAEAREALERARRLAEKNKMLQVVEEQASELRREVNYAAHEVPEDPALTAKARDLVREGVSEYQK